MPPPLRLTDVRMLEEAPKQHHAHLTSGRLLARNTVWNLTGLVAPTVVAVFCIPTLIRGLGKDQFGVLALAWALIGYASLFDLGLGRALTQLVAKQLGAGEEREVPRTAWTSLLLMLGLGAVGATAIAGLCPWLVHRVLKIPGELQVGALRSFYLLAVSIPVVIVSAGLRGLLEAHQRFDLVTYVRVPLGVFTFAGPLLVLPFSKSLAPMVGVLVVARLVGCAAFFLMCLRAAPELLQGIVWHGPSVGPLLRFGGWMTVTNVVGPLMVTLDRFLIGAMVSMSAVAYYATPYEIVTKLLVIPGAVVGVLFPAFSASFANNRDKAGLLYGRTLKCLLVVLLPIVLLIVALARNGLTLWLGSDFAQHSTHVVQWLAFGVLANSLAQVPFSFIQGVGRPDLTAKLHLAELPVYLLMLTIAIRVDGIEGTAIAWSARAAVDALALFFMARRFLVPGTLALPKTKSLAVSRPVEMR